ncbi:MAG: DUF5320 domain-containing protein [Acidimicrobiia bacterium]|nr:DUF5320 domain-containing protein [Acidimicrobiia bacterium]
MRWGYGMRGRQMMARRMMTYGGCHGPYEEPSVEDRLAFLEEYQRDLEQETADVAERIRRLKERASTSEESTV